jgi:K+-transporting ATPase ATPase C chain
MFNRELITALRMLLVFVLVTGLVYPLVIMFIGWAFFSHANTGQLLHDEASGKVYGSRLVGQHFEDPVYFWGRPSVTKPAPYTPFDQASGAAATGSNMGPNDPRLMEAIKLRTEKYRKADPENREPIPVDLVTASASGIDPHISPAGARFQAGRVARLRGVEVEKVHELIRQHTFDRDLGILGEPRVNVLTLNVALDKAYPARKVSQ